MHTLTDAHCHLDQLADLDAAITEARCAGVSRMLSCSEDIGSMDRNLALADRYPGTVLPGFGLHPAVVVHQSDETVADGLERLAQLLPRADFMGEIGLDFLHASDAVAQERQRDILETQLVMAGKAGLPVCLHSRRAQRATMTVALRYVETWGLPALLHWFTQSTKLIRVAISASGVFLSAGPSVLLSEQAGAVAGTIPPDRLLVETDSPVTFGGAPARPAWIPRVVAIMAPLYRMSEQELTIQLDENLNCYLYSSRPRHRIDSHGGSCP